MTTDVHVPEETDEAVYCTVHPKVETALRCNKCGRPMCNNCAVRTPVGYRCKECVRDQGQVFYSGKTTDLFIQFPVAFILSAIAAGLIIGLTSFIGFFYFALIIGVAASSAAGGFIADLAHRAAGKRRHRYSWIAVAAGVALGGLAVMVVPALVMGAIYAQVAANTPPDQQVPIGMFGGFLYNGLGGLIYLVAATVAATGRLRIQGGRLRLG